MKLKFYVFTYDISNDKNRQKTARICESRLQRVQGSVFEGYLNESDARQLLKKLIKYLKEGDSLRVYQLCSACRSKIILKGSAILTKEPGLMII